MFQFATVYKARDTEDGNKIVAVKKVSFAEYIVRFRLQSYENMENLISCVFLLSTPLFIMKKKTTTMDSFHTMAILILTMQHMREDFAGEVNWVLYLMH